MFNNLFKPIKIEKLEIKNRIVLSPMGIGAYNDDETISVDYIDFLESRAQDTGLIITTGCRVSQKYGKLKFFGIYDDAKIPGLRTLAKKIHDKGSKIFLQILALGGLDIEEPYVPSIDVPEYSTEWGFDVKPKELRTEQIKELVEEFAQAARRAKESGIDGVELFGSEDALISNFITPYFNKRKDEYGGNFENYLRFPVEIIKRIKNICDDDYPVGFKFNAFYDLPNGIDVETGKKIANKIISSGGSYIHVFTFAKNDKPMSLFKYPPLPNLYQQRNSTIEITREIKKEIKRRPVIGVSGILKPHEADEILDKGYADMVAIGRGFIADNRWSSNAKSLERIRPCIRCHVCHNEVAIIGNIVSCSVNPDVFGKDSIVISSKPKKIIIVGAGPAGITAALTASKRGHDVTLYEKEKEIGGKLIPGSRPDFKHEFSDYLEYLRSEVDESDILLIKDFEVTPDFISENKPDVLILAMGALPVIPDIKGLKNTEYMIAEKALIDAEGIKGKKIIVIGGGDVGCETALYLKKNNEVNIIEKLSNLMEEEDIKYNSVVLEKMLIESGVNIYTGADVTEVRKNNLIFNVGSNNKELDYELLVLATGYRVVSNDIISSFTEEFKELVTIGDCNELARLKEAIKSGYEIGKKI